MARRSAGIGTALAGSLREIPDASRTGALAALAKAYASEIDRSEDRLAALAQLGPKLQAALAALGLVAAPAGTGHSRIPPDGRLTTDAPPAPGSPQGTSPPNRAAAVLDDLRAARRRGGAAG